MNTLNLTASAITTIRHMMEDFPEHTWDQRVLIFCNDPKMMWDGDVNSYLSTWGAPRQAMKGEIAVQLSQINVHDINHASEINAPKFAVRYQEA